MSVTLSINSEIIGFLQVSVPLLTNRLPNFLGIFDQRPSSVIGTILAPKAQGSFHRAICVDLNGRNVIVTVSKNSKRIGVVGEGVSGLSSAIRVAEDGNQVTVIANARGNQTTSSIAAAFWYPFWTGAEPDHSWYETSWAERTYLILETLSAEPTTGITEVSLYEYFSQAMTEREIENVVQSMWWRHLPAVRFRRFGADECGNKSVGDAHFKSGISFRTFVVHMSDYLTYLKRRCDELGVSFESGTVLDLGSLASRFDLIVNCSGMGARKLVPHDVKEGIHRLSPVEGVVVRLSALEEVSDISLIHTGRYFDLLPAYIVPRGGSNPDIIIGGTITPESSYRDVERRACTPQHLSWSTLSSDHWLRLYADRIIEDCYELEPKLQDANILEVKVGYRPGRAPKVRVEKEGKIIHNYGHAGGGLTLSWGCAELVTTLIR